MTIATMHAQLTLLLEIQDLRSKLKELEAESGLVVLETEQFELNVTAAVGALREKIQELEAMLAEPVRRRYERIAGHVARVVVPVIAETCYGCFVSVPAATAGGSDPNAELQTCQHCGRFLYFLS